MYTDTSHETRYRVVEPILSGPGDYAAHYLLCKSAILVSVGTQTLHACVINDYFLTDLKLQDTSDCKYMFCIARLMNILYVRKLMTWKV